MAIIYKPKASVTPVGRAEAAYNQATHKITISYRDIVNADNADTANVAVKLVQGALANTASNPVLCRFAGAFITIPFAGHTGTATLIIGDSADTDRIGTIASLGVQKAMTPTTTYQSVAGSGIAIQLNALGAGNKANAMTAGEVEIYLDILQPANPSY